MGLHERIRLSQPIVLRAGDGVDFLGKFNLLLAFTFQTLSVLFFWSVGAFEEICMLILKPCFWWYDSCENLKDWCHSNPLQNLGGSVNVLSILKRYQGLIVDGFL